MLRQTQIGRWEQDMDPRWLSPYHCISIEVETKRGIERRNVAGMRRSSKIIRFLNKPEEVAEFLKT